MQDESNITTDVQHFDRRTLLTAAGATGASLLAGCAGSGSSTSQSIQTGKEAYEDAKINGLLKEGYEAAVINDYHSDFEKATGVDVTLEQYSEANTRQKFILAANNKSNAYNFAPVQNWYFPEYSKNSWMQPLDGYLEDSQAEWVNFDYEAIPETVRNVFSKDGTTYGIPHTLITGMHYYRTDVLEDLGLDEPKTVKDVVQVAAAIDESDKDIIPMLGRIAPEFSSFGTWAGWAYAYGAITLDENQQPQLTSPEWQEAASDLMKLMRDYGPQSASFHWTDIPSLINEGEAAMVFDTSGFGGIFHGSEQVGDKISETLLTGPADNTAQWFYGEALSIPEWLPAEQKGPAWQFLQWRQSEEVVFHEMRTQNRFDIPNNKVLASEEYNSLAEKRGLTNYIDVLQKSFEKLDPSYYPMVPQFVDIGNAFMQEMSKAVSGNQSTEEALTKANDAIEEIMSDS